MIHGVHHIGLAVHDRTAACRFHRHVIGGRPDPAALLAGLNFRLELHDAVPEDHAVRPPELNRPGVRHYCAQNFACSKLVECVEDGGGALMAEPVDLGTGNDYAYARDPEGNIIEVEGLPYAPQTEPTWIGHVALVTSDIAAAAAFYAALLGVTASAPRRVGPSPAIDHMGGLPGAILLGVWLNAGPIALELWQFEKPAFTKRSDRKHFTEPGFSHIAFECDDPAAEQARLLTLGARTVAASYGADPTPGAALSRFVMGPDGVLIELVSMQDPALCLNGLADPGVVARVEGR